MYSLFIAVTAVFVIAGVWTAWKGLKRVPVGHQAILTLFGARISRPILGEGLKIIPLPGIFDIISIDARFNPLKVKVTDIWSPSNPREEAPIESMGLVHFEAEISLKYRVLDPFRFLDVASQAALTTLVHDLAQDFLRREFLARQAKAILDRREQERIKEQLIESIAESAEEWGVEVTDVYLTLVDVDEPEVKKAMQKFFQERQEREAEVYETETVIRQALTNLTAIGIAQGHPEYNMRLEKEIDRIRRWRIQETSAKSGRAVVVPFPNRISVDLGGKKKP